MDLIKLYHLLPPYLQNIAISCYSIILQHRYYGGEFRKWCELLDKQERLTSQEIVDLQTEVVKTVLDQFNNGSITSTTYLIELNKLATSKLNLEANKVQLIFAKYQYLSATGQL